MKCGDLPNALKSFSRARDYCVSAKQLVEMCLNVIEVGFEALE
jgi:COP9 signalosome complex subunit 1